MTIKVTEYISATSYPSFDRNTRHHPPGMMPLLLCRYHHREYILGLLLARIFQTLLSCRHCDVPSNASSDHILDRTLPPIFAVNALGCLGVGFTHRVPFLAGFPEGLVGNVED